MPDALFKPSPRTLAKNRVRAENQALLAEHRRYLRWRDARQVACQEMGVPFGPVRLGPDCLGEATGATITGQVTAWTMTNDRSAIVSADSRASL